MKKQPLEAFYKKPAQKIFCNIHGKTPEFESLVNKLQLLNIFLKKLYFFLKRESLTHICHDMKT